MTDSPTALFVFDFDGTVYDGSAEDGIDPAFPAMVDEIRDGGGSWAISTGRTLFEAFEGIQRLGREYLPDYLMVKERELYRPGDYPHRWHDFGDWNHRCRSDHKRFLKTHRRLFKRLRKVVEKEFGATFIENADEPPAVVTDSEEHMDRFCDHLEEAPLAEAPTLGYERNSIYLRFSHSDYHKGSVMAELQRLLGVGPENTFAAGDNHNDLSMLDPARAEFLVCPSNALPVVKERVGSHHRGHVASHPTARGIAEGFQAFARELLSPRP